MSKSIELEDGDRCLLGSYQVGGAERVLFGEQINGRFCIYDQRGDQRGAKFLVEEGITEKSELAVFLADYKQTAARLGRCPMEPDG